MTTTEFETRLLEMKNRFVRGLPDRVEAIAEGLRQRQAGRSEFEETLERQFHNLAGTAGTYGFLEIAAVASDGFDGCAHLNRRIEGDARYLWSVVEELEDQAAHLTCPNAGDAAIVQSMDSQVTTMGREERR